MRLSLVSWFARLLQIYRTARRRKCGAAGCPAGVFALANLPCGVCVMVRALELKPETADRLRQMGLREGCQVCLLSQDDPYLVSIDNARIALDASLARHIRVESL